MPDALHLPLLLLATVTTGLMAGFYYAFACAVMPGLARTRDDVVVPAMVAVNTAVQNLLFAVGFFGSFLLVAGALLTGVLAGGATVLPTAAALALYVLSLVVTFRVNIPLNVGLEVAATRGDARARRDFERPWVRANAVRGLCATASLACLAWALVVHEA
ncbi:anthrone oxygenase family protein [Sanguibacter suaedae]|uniref:DUF1772 domain-containing protein n=1 Tax=Sanguibacter suaedae TaxID=2795737 RepID=A0A934I6Q1_9MICO|nr:anthrone oxygenase family protein [Sanguibacter suaedae]MBI9114197.1 DUF1772 domain-containing protein [Sanguibacter suaedae]